MIRAFCFGVSFCVAEQFLHLRQHRLGPQFPDQVRDLVVPLGEMLVEVRKNRIAPSRIRPAGNVQRGEVEVVMAVVNLASCKM